MSFEVSPDLLFALILAAAAGWFGGQVLRRRTQSSANRRTEPFNTQYFAGLNHLLNEQQDKALEVLRRMAEIDADTVETQLALGHLYRRRGEVDRAIRVHESVMQRTDIPVAMRAQASIALGEDYLRAGLLDRAETCFQSLLENTTHRTSALRGLIAIYEQQGDWQQAIAMHERLTIRTSAENPTAIAHYHCELAQQARDEGSTPLALEYLRKVRTMQRNFPRSALLRADFALLENNPRLAAALCRNVIELHPHLLPVALPAYVRALKAAGVSIDTADEALRLNITEPAQRARLAYAALVSGVLDEPFVLDCLDDFLRQDPNLGDLVNALAGNMSQLQPAVMANAAAALSKVFKRTQRYRCVSCGVTTGMHFWQCPGCRSWDTLVSLTRLELSPTVR